MEEISKLIVELQKNGEQQVTLKEILNPVGDNSLLIKFLKTTQLIHRIYIIIIIIIIPFLWAGRDLGCRWMSWTRSNIESLSSDRSGEKGIKVSDPLLQ